MSSWLYDIRQMMRLVEDTKPRCLEQYNLCALWKKSSFVLSIHSSSSSSPTSRERDGLKVLYDSSDVLWLVTDDKFEFAASPWHWWHRQLDSPDQVRPYLFFYTCMVFTQFVYWISRLFAYTCRYQDFFSEAQEVFITLNLMRNTNGSWL